MPDDRDSAAAHLRELEMPDGRKLLLDRRAIAFVCEGKAEDFDGKRVTNVGFKTSAYPVTAGYYDLKSWWRERQQGSPPPCRCRIRYRD